MFANFNAEAGREDCMRMRWKGHVARMGEMRNVNNIQVGISEMITTLMWEEWI
jgi:hypothetical protein